MSKAKANAQKFADSTVKSAIDLQENITSAVQNLPKKTGSIKYDLKSVRSFSEQLTGKQVSNCINNLVSGKAGNFIPFDDSNFSLEQIANNQKISFKPPFVKIDDGTGNWKRVSGLNQLLLLQQCGAFGYPISQNGIYYLKEKHGVTARTNPSVFDISQKDSIKSHSFSPVERTLREKQEEKDSQKKRQKSGVWDASDPEISVVDYLAAFCMASILEEEFITTTGNMQRMSIAFNDIISNMRMPPPDRILDFNQLNQFSKDIDNKMNALATERSRTFLAKETEKSIGYKRELERDVSPSLLRSVESPVIENKRSFSIER